jgi:hypothetical protein
VLMLLQARVQRLVGCCLFSCILQAGAGPCYCVLQMILELIVCTAAKLYKLCVLYCA